MPITTETTGTNTVRGTAGDDVVRGTGGNDNLIGGRGEDRMIGGKGNDVMSGGMDADTFVWSAGHIGDGNVDYVTDFSFRQGDSIQFLDSGNNQEFNILSVERTGTDVTEANGVDLRNDMRNDRQNDVVFTVENSVTGATQEIVFLDSWSNSANDDWLNLLAEMGLDGFGPAEEEEIPVAEVEEVLEEPVPVFDGYVDFV